MSEKKRIIRRDLENYYRELGKKLNRKMNKREEDIVRRIKDIEETMGSIEFLLENLAMLNGFETTLEQALRVTMDDIESERQFLTGFLDGYREERESSDNERYPLFTIKKKIDLNLESLTGNKEEETDRGVYPCFTSKGLTWSTTIKSEHGEDENEDDWHNPLEWGD